MALIWHPGMPVEGLPKSLEDILQKHGHTLAPTAQESQLILWPLGPRGTTLSGMRETLKPLSGVSALVFLPSEAPDSLRLDAIRAGASHLALTPLHEKQLLSWLAMILKPENVLSLHARPMPRDMVRFGVLQFQELFSRETLTMPASFVTPVTGCVVRLPAGESFDSSFWTRLRAIGVDTILVRGTDLGNLAHRKVA